MVDVGRCGITLPVIRHAALFLRRKRPGTLGGELSVVAVRGAETPALQAHLTAPYRPRYSLDQRTAGRYLGGLGNPGDGHVPTRLPSTSKG